MDYTIKYLLVLLAVFHSTVAQVQRKSILETLQQSSGLRTFGSWCQEAMPTLYSGDVSLTVFAFNDTSFATMPSQDRAALTTLTTKEKKQYVMTYTVENEVSIDSLMEGMQIRSSNGKELFINKRNRYYFGNAGTTGRQATYVNGAMIINEMIPCKNGIIHVLDRPLGLISNKNVYEWLSEPEGGTNTDKFKQLVDRLYGQFFSQAIAPVSTATKVTMFLPSQEALSNIPANKLALLSGQELSNYFQMHYIPGKVVFTSYVEHQESYQSGYRDSRILFLRNEDRVMVKSGGVTAMIERGNITTKNGVIHIIDKMFGFVYFSAREQIAQDAPYFNGMINDVSPAIQSLITQPNGVNMFVPTEAAWQYVQAIPWLNFAQNQTLKDFIVRLCLIRDGSIEVAQLNGAYDVRQRRYSRYDDWKLVIYNDRNDTWVNGGNVRAKITRPDVKVTTGTLQYIDAVIGVPSMDIPTLIYYDDYLLQTWYDLKMTGLDKYMEDQRYNPSILPPRSFNGNGFADNNFGNQWTTRNPYGQTQNPYGQTQNPYGQQTQNPYGQQNQYPQNQQQVASYGLCGDTVNVCQFTLFVPNGTAIYNYKMTNLGYKISQDTERYRFIFRRLLIPNQLIFLEQLAVDQRSNTYRTHSGEDLTVRKESDNSVRIYWGSMNARVILWDLGATNGVVHIIDTVLSDLSDLDRDISGAVRLSATSTSAIAGLAVLLSIFMKRYIS